MKQTPQTTAEALAFLHEDDAPDASYYVDAPSVPSSSVEQKPTEIFSLTPEPPTDPEFLARWGHLKPI
jgi:hypothetical protein